MFLTIQSCTLLAGTDVRWPTHGAPSPPTLAPPAGPGEASLRRCAAHVARLRGGGGDVGGISGSEAAPPEKRSWAERLRSQAAARSSSRSRTPSVNVAAGDAPMPDGLETTDGMQAQRISMEMLADMDLNAGGEEDLDDAEDNGGNIMPFMTDVEIREQAAKQQGPGTKAGQDRDLEPFQCDDELPEGCLEDDPDVEFDSSKRVKGFDQFKVNEDKFGIKTNPFNENDYTAPIDTSDPAYAEQLQRAELLAAEMKSSWNAGGPMTTSNMHVRDERNLPLPDDLDEATLYSTVTPRRPADPVAGQLMGEDRGANHAPRSSYPCSAPPPFEEEEEEEVEEMNSVEMEQKMQGAYDRFVKLIDNGDPMPPELEEITSQIQVSLARCYSTFASSLLFLFFLLLFPTRPSSPPTAWLSCMCIHTQTARASNSCTNTRVGACITLLPERQRA